MIPSLLCGLVTNTKFLNQPAGLRAGNAWGILQAMGIADLMSEIRKLTDDELLALAAQVDAEAARAVDTKFTALVREGDFDELAAEALKELKEGKSIPLHEVLDEHHIP
jgi:hypothetical protein